MSKDLLNLSDEELMSLDPSALEGFSLGGETISEDVGDDTGNQEEDAGNGAGNATPNDNKDETDGSEGEGSGQEGQGRGQGQESDEEEGLLTEEEKSASDEEVEGDKPETSEEADDGEAASEKEEKTPEEEETPEGAIDYKREYERLLAPFKANGRDIQVKSVEDAISLMQMGANYNKKMAALKPNLKLMKMLENSGLLSEEKLSYLIDLDKKNPAAISKLVNESGLDPLDLDSEKASGYKPNTYTVDERELDLDAVLDEIQHTAGYDKTLDIVSNKWDKASKQAIANTPQLLKVINAHVERGIYDQIIAEVENERLFGRLRGISDLEAYRQVGDAIQARGGFAHLGRQEQPAPTAPKVVTPKPKKEEDAKLREKRRAASTTKPAASTAPVQDFNPLALSDEEFSKAANSKFL